ncbi:MAG: BsuPI-related putative proteinase inhibitor [Candidatus Syntrophopropionicum ammoniitolerans]
MMATYTVQTGDTLFLIAQRFGTTVEALIQVNNITNPDVIFVGQILTIPGAMEEEVEGGGEVIVVPDGSDNMVTRRSGSLLYTLSTNRRTYNRGEDVVITLIKTNTGNTNITLRYPTTQRFEFTARSSSGQTLVWNWSKGRIFPRVAGTVTLRPQERQVFRVVWSQRNNRGVQGPWGSTPLRDLMWLRG